MFEVTRELCKHAKQREIHTHNISLALTEHALGTLYYILEIRKLHVVYYVVLAP